MKTTLSMLVGSLLAVCLFACGDAADVEDGAIVAGEVRSSGEDELELIKKLYNKAKPTAGDLDTEEELKNVGITPPKPVAKKRDALAKTDGKQTIFRWRTRADKKIYWLVEGDPGNGSPVRTLNFFHEDGKAVGECFVTPQAKVKGGIEVCAPAT